MLGFISVSANQGLTLLPASKFSTNLIKGCSTSSVSSSVPPTTIPYWLRSCLEPNDTLTCGLAPCVNIPASNTSLLNTS